MNSPTRRIYFFDWIVPNSTLSHKLRFGAEAAGDLSARLTRTLCELSKSSANEGALLLRSALSFGPFTLPGRGPRFAIDRNFGLCRRTHKIWCEYHGFLELILFSGKRNVPAHVIVFPLTVIVNEDLVPSE